MSLESLKRTNTEMEQAWEEFCKNNTSGNNGDFTKPQRGLFFAGYYGRVNQQLRKENKLGKINADRFTFDEICDAQHFEHLQEFVLYEDYLTLKDNLNSTIQEMSNLHDEKIATQGQMKSAIFVYEEQLARYRSSVPTAMQVIRNAILTDPGYKIGWVANIAMAFKDEYNRQLKISDPMWGINLHTIANNAAENFLQTLCMDTVSQQEKVGKEKAALLVPTKCKCQGFYQPRDCTIHGRQHAKP
jgi:hypothetical protein